MAKSFKLIISVFTIAIFGLLFSNTGNVHANALVAPWTVAVTYQNVGTQAATLIVNFYPEGSSSAISFNPLSTNETLAPGAAKSFWIGNVNNVPAGFRGNAVISADQPLTATAVQFSQQAGFKMRLLYNGFQGTDMSNQYFIPTVLLNRFQRTTVFSIQNTESEAINAEVRFYDADANGALASSPVHTIPANSSKFIELNDSSDTGLGSRTTFNGSVIIVATKVSGGGAANVVAAANEYYIDRNVAASFEGVPLSRASNTVYMATGLCQRFGLDTFYAVTNASLSQSANITVNYRNTDGATVATDGPYSIGPGQKRSINSCAPSSGTNMTGFTGSAFITSTGAPIVAIGRAQNSINAGTSSTADVFTAFIGEPAGASEVSLSFVRWANDAEYNSASNSGGSQRTFIAIQNLENSTIKVNVFYVDKNGNTVGNPHVLTIPAFAKGNTSAGAASVLGLGGMKTGSFGYYTDNTFGGGVTIKAHPDNPSATFIAIARGQNPGAGEDVNGVPKQ